MYDDFYGQNANYFFGVVEEQIDEVYIRVRVFGIHPIDKTLVPMNHLPPALVIYPTTGGQVSGGTSSHNIQVDTWVMGMFLDYPVCMNPIVTGVVQGTDFSMSNYNKEGGVFVGQGSSDSDYGEIPNNGETINLEGKNNIQKTYNYVYDKLVSEGSSSDPHMHTSALVGNLLLETTGINPATVNSIGAWGICQWLDAGKRRTKFFQKYGKSKQLSHQLDYMWWELNGVEGAAKRKWLGANNLTDAAAGFAHFERNEMFVRNTGKLNRNHKNFRQVVKYSYQVYNNQQLKRTS